MKQKRRQAKSHLFEGDEGEWFAFAGSLGIAGKTRGGQWEVELDPHNDTKRGSRSCPQIRDAAILSPDDYDLWRRSGDGRRSIPSVT